jgi:hypothetical protein
MGTVPCGTPPPAATAGSTRGPGRRRQRSHSPPRGGPGPVGFGALPVSASAAMPTTVRQAMCVRDEGRSLGAGLRRQAPNHLEAAGLGQEPPSCTFRDFLPLVCDEARVDECRPSRDDGGDQTCRLNPDGASHDIIASGHDIVPAVLSVRLAIGSQIGPQAGVALHRRHPRARPEDRHQLDPRRRPEPAVSALLPDYYYPLAVATG